ncbi:MAG TPA: hypothetical protein VIR56_02585 [Solimonas sp.]
MSAEDTFAEDLPLAMLAPHIRRLAEKTWAAACKTERVPRTVVLKLKTRDFRILTRSLTPPHAPTSFDEFANMALALCERVIDEGDPDTAPTLYRLVGVGLSNFHEADDPRLQADLFAGNPA